MPVLKLWPVTMFFHFRIPEVSKVRIKLFKPFAGILVMVWVPVKFALPLKEDEIASSLLELKNTQGKAES